MDAIFRKVFKQTCRCIFFSLNFILIFDILFLGFSMMQIDHLIFIKKSFLAYHKAWGIIVPRPGIKPLSPAVDAHALYGFEPPGKSFFAHFKFYFLIVFPFLILLLTSSTIWLSCTVWPGAWSILSLVCQWLKTIVSGFPPSSTLTSPIFSFLLFHRLPFSRLPIRKK